MKPVFLFVLPSVGEVRHVVIMFILDSERQLLSAQGGAVNKPDHNILVNISEHLGLRICFSWDMRRR